MLKNSASEETSKIRVKDMYESYQEIYKQGESLRKSFDYVLSRQEEIKDFFKTSDFDEIVFVAKTIEGRNII